MEWTLCVADLLVAYFYFVVVDMKVLGFVLNPRIPDDVINIILLYTACQVSVLICTSL